MGSAQQEGGRQAGRQGRRVPAEPVSLAQRPTDKSGATQKKAKLLSSPHLYFTSFLVLPDIMGGNEELLQIKTEGMFHGPTTRLGAANAK